MKKKSSSNHTRWLPPVLGGVLCVTLTALAVWDAVARHGGRLVYPMDSYAFQRSDIPMLLALAIDALYVLYLAFLTIRWGAAQKRQVRETGRTRRLNPKFGFLGFLGFLGFAGFWGYKALGDMSGFTFFAFFGFFGFFFEGKMSNTLMDERFKENAAKAERKAYRAGFSVIFFMLILSGQAGRFKAELIAPVLMTGVALAVALTMFLAEYLLYRYDHDDAMELEGEE